MSSRTSQYLINISITLILISFSQSSLCPKMCSCIWRNGKQTSLCQKKAFIAIPTGIPSSTQVLNISVNNFQILPSRVFQERGLINLQKLFLSKCNLSKIAVDAFIQLTNLVELDLNDNLLRTIPSESIGHCSSLRRLILSSNRFGLIKYESFSNLKSLIFLDLSSSEIDSIESHAFRGLNKLQFLKLDSNRLQTLAPDVVSDLPSLYSLDLSSNPWNCDCHLRPSLQWIISNKVALSLPPQCKKPQTLKETSWNLLQIDQFSCSPQLHTELSQFSHRVGNNITISCSASGFPLPSMKWLFEYHTDLNLSSANIRDQRYSIDENTNGTTMTSIITIIDLKIEDSQHFICSAQNSGGVAYKNFSLTVLPIPESNSSISLTKIQIICTLTGLILLLSLILILVAILLIRSKSNSSVHTSSGPKLPPIDVLQNIQDSRFEIKNTYSLKPEITFISDAINNMDDRKEPEAKTHDSALFRPDVANTQSNYLADQTSSLSNILINSFCHNPTFSLNVTEQYSDQSYSYHDFNELKLQNVHHKTQSAHKSSFRQIYLQNFNSITDKANDLNQVPPNLLLQQLKADKLLEQSEIKSSSPCVDHLQTLENLHQTATQV